MRRQELEIPSRHGHSIHAVLELPINSKVESYAIFCHCFTCTKQIRAAVVVSRALAQKGIAVLRFDFSGLGESEGDFADTTFSSNIEDFADVAAYLSTHYAPPELAVGHSLGGAAVLYGAAQIPSLKALATIGAPADPAHVLHLIAARRPEIETEGEAEVDLAGRTFRIKKAFIDDLKAQCNVQALTEIKQALLLLHAPQDQTVGIDNASQIFVAAKHPKSFVSLDNADHLLSRTSDADYAAEVIAAWASRYVGSSGEAASDASGRVLVSTGRQGFLTEMQLRQHHLVADEPVRVGGEDAGPSPYDLLSMALGSCTTMTLQMYAKRKGWPLERATVAVDHAKIHAKDCEDCETEQGHIDHFERELSLEGELDDVQRQRLLEIADRCPVHRTLHAEVKVNTRLT